MICPNCRKDVEGVWDENFSGDKYFICENCNFILETENSYEDYVSDMKEEGGRYENMENFSD